MGSTGRLRMSFGIAHIPSRGECERHIVYFLVPKRRPGGSALGLGGRCGGAGKVSGAAGMPEGWQRLGSGPSRRRFGACKRWSAGWTEHSCTVLVVLRRSHGMGAWGMPTAPGSATARFTPLRLRRCQRRLCPPLSAVSRPPDQRWKESERWLDNHVFGQIKQSRGLAIECRSLHCRSRVVSRVGYLPNWGFFRLQNAACGWL